MLLLNNHPVFSHPHHPPFVAAHACYRGMHACMAGQALQLMVPVHSRALTVQDGAGMPVYTVVKEHCGDHIRPCRTAHTYRWYKFWSVAEQIKQLATVPRCQHTPSHVTFCTLALTTRPLRALAHRPQHTPSRARCCQHTALGCKGCEGPQKPPSQPGRQSPSAHILTGPLSVIRTLSQGTERSLLHQHTLT